MELELDYHLWRVLVWIDNKINHTIVDWFFDLFPVENKDGSETLSFVIWQNTSYKFCCWVITEFGDEIYDKYSHKYNLE